MDDLTRFRERLFAALRDGPPLTVAIAADTAVKIFGPEVKRLRRELGRERARRRQARADATADRQRAEKAKATIKRLTEERDQAGARLRELENAINWQVSCTNCARLLSASADDHDRAQQAKAERDEARMWARAGYEIGQRSCTWSDHGVAPAWLTEGWPTSFPSDLVAPDEGETDPTGDDWTVDLYDAITAEVRASESSPGQWIHAFNQVTGEERLARLARLWEAVGVGGLCILQNHKGRLEFLEGEVERRCSCDGDPIECSHEAARGQAEAAIERVRLYAETWAALAPPGSSGTDAAFAADLGRTILAALAPLTPDDRNEVVARIRAHGLFGDILALRKDVDRRLHRALFGDPAPTDTTGETETPARRLTEQQGGIPNDAITPDDPYQRGI